MTSEKILLTGSMGCIGTWVMRQLFDEGADFIASDLSLERTRPALLMTPDELDVVHWLQLDVTDTAAVRDAVTNNGITHIVHLAGLQVPFCKASPALGAAVNVVGTANILEAARHGKIRGLAYASSMAVFGPAKLYPETPIPDDAPLAPDTLYGTYKVANEESARIFWQDWRVGSVGLRPGVVYGVARDQGMSADIAKAILAVAADLPFHIRFDGPVALQHAGDAAAIFIGCARAEHQGAMRCNLRNDVIDVAEFVSMMEAIYPQARITFEKDAPMPVANDLDDSNLRSLLGRVPHLPLRQAIEQDIARYRQLIDKGAIDLTQLDR